MADAYNQCSKCNHHCERSLFYVDPIWFYGSFSKCQPANKNLKRNTFKYLYGRFQVIKKK
jgi:hypothetical protein